MKTAGEDAADIVWDIALTAHADAVAAFQQANRGFRDGGRAAAGVAVLVAERERTSAINQPDLPIAPPPRLKGKPGP